MRVFIPSRIVPHDSQDNWKKPAKQGWREVITIVAEAHRREANVKFDLVRIAIWNKSFRFLTVKQIPKVPSGCFVKRKPGPQGPRQQQKHARISIPDSDEDLSDLPVDHPDDQEEAIPQPKVPFESLCFIHHTHTMLVFWSSSFSMGTSHERSR